MKEEEVLRLLTERGAVRRGHFLLSSGKHSDVYVEKARVLEDPALTARLGEEIAGWYDGVEVVVSPAVGALPLGFGVALAAGARFVYAEREGGHMALRRGFEISKGERTLVVEAVGVALWSTGPPAIYCSRCARWRVSRPPRGIRAPVRAPRRARRSSHRAPAAWPETAGRLA